MTYSPPIQAGSQRYLELLANTALSADERLDKDLSALWPQLDQAWKDLEANQHDPSTLARLALIGTALLCLETGTPVPHLAAEAATLHIDKNAGYAGIGNPDPWANFRLASAFGVSPYDGVLVRLSDKYIRIQNLRARADNNRVGENLLDTLKDLIAYALIAICLWEEAQLRLDGGLA